MGNGHNVPVGDVEAAVNGTLEHTKDTRTSGGSVEANVQEGAEGARALVLQQVTTMQVDEYIQSHSLSRQQQRHDNHSDAETWGSTWYSAPSGLAWPAYAEARLSLVKTF